MKRILTIIYKRITKYINSVNIKQQKIEIVNNYVFNGIPYIRNFGVIKIGKNFKGTSGKNFNPIGGDTVLRIYARKNAEIIIGNNVGISNSTLHICKKLTIDDNVIIGGSTKIWDSDFHSIDSNDRINNGDMNIISKPIHIKKNCFIGGSSIILKGVTIGENSIVAAGSVVTKSIPSNEIWGGNPAKKLKGLAND